MSNAEKAAFRAVILANLLFGIFLFIFIRLSYNWYSVNVLDYLTLDQAAYYILQIIRVVFSILLGVKIQQKIDQNFKNSQVIIRRSVLALLLGVWIAYALNLNLHYYLTDFTLQIGVGPGLNYSELSAFRQWIYESFIAPWQWLAYLGTLVAYRVADDKKRAKQSRRANMESQTN